MVGCLFLALSFLLPRLTLVILQMATTYLHVYTSYLWPILGFVFMPYTTLGYAIAMNEWGGIKDGGIVVLIVGVILDMCAHHSTSVRNERPE